MFVFPQNSYWKFNTQCDGIRKWGHGRVLRSWGWRLIGSMVLCSFKWDPTGFHSPFLHERTQAAYVMEEGPHPTMLAVWSRVSSFHTCEKYIPIVYKLITGGSVVKNTPAMWRCRRHGFGPRVGKSLWRRKWQPTPVFLLANLMDWGVWQATVYGVAKSWTWLSHWAHKKEETWLTRRLFSWYKG